jgi:hypothetical protein
MTENIPATNVKVLILESFEEEHTECESDTTDWG